jgi:hypothetical protein
MYPKSMDMISRDLPHQRSKFSPNSLGIVLKKNIKKKKYKIAKKPKKAKIKQFKKLAINYKSKKNKRRKLKRSVSENDEVQNLINIKTQAKDASTIYPTNVSFAYDSVDVFKIKPKNEEIDDSLAKISTCKFANNDQSGGNMKKAHSLLKKRVKVRKMSMYMKKGCLNKKSIRQNYVHSGNTSNTKKKKYDFL